MKALTVKAPWSHAIMFLGKNVENRSWSTDYRGDLVIHAGSSRSEFEIEPDEWQYDYDCKMPTMKECTFGAVIGIVTLCDCVMWEDAPDSLWAHGPWCWLLRDPRPFARSVITKGFLGLWDWK